jgi:5-methylcytosine-specific restriction endonuclease McrA
MKKAVKKYHTFQWCGKCFVQTDVEEHKPCCNNSDMQYVRFKQSNDVYTLRRQCSNCLTLHPNSFKKTLVPNFEAIPEYTPFMSHTERWQEYNKFRTYIREQQQRIFEDSKDEWGANYAKYLSSAEWQKKRQLILKRDNYICQGCLANNATEVHHKTYVNVGNEFCFELISLCDDCHSSIHTKDSE